jgi:hypothetical protein
MADFDRRGSYPVWSRTGKELLFETPEFRLMATNYDVQGDTFVPGTPHLWSHASLAVTGSVHNYDLAPDGKRLATVAIPEGIAGQKPLTRLTFLLNFADELRRRVALNESARLSRISQTSRRRCRNRHNH